MTPLSVLFVKESQNWPRANGHDVHGFNMMKAFAARGHAVSLAAVKAPTVRAIEGLPLANVFTLDDVKVATRLPPLTLLQGKFADYFGVSEHLSRALAALLERNAFDAVVIVARHLLPLLSVVRGPVRVWYPADDPAWHHLSRFKPRDRQTWGEIKLAAVNAIYERAFRSLYDRIWVVSAKDRTFARLITGCGQVDLIPNGVDADDYAPGASSDLPRSVVFWGRLDFGPNVDALAWFLANVWPGVKAAESTARFDVFGFNATPQVRKLAEAYGVKLFADLPDLRAEVQRREVVVLPFVSGGGIKNKLLEAAALGMPIVCTPWALSGMKGKPAVKVARTPREWVEAILSLWANSKERTALGMAARQWVVRHHAWDTAAAVAEAGIRKSIV